MSTPQQATRPATTTIYLPNANPIAATYTRYARPAATSSSHQPGPMSAREMGLNLRYFPRRRNCDGSYDSICMACFQTVAHGMEEWELGMEEARHVCGEG